MLKIKKIKPPYTKVVVTGEKYAEDMYDDHGLIENKKGDLKAYQRVIAVGPSVRNLEVGDKVMVDLLKFAVWQYDPNSVKEDMGMNKIKGFRFNWITIDDEKGNPQECLYLDENDILFAYEGEEVQGTKNPIILPKEKKVIVGN